MKKQRTLGGNDADLNPDGRTIGPVGGLGHGHGHGPGPGSVVQDSSMRTGAVGDSNGGPAGMDVGTCCEGTSTADGRRQALIIRIRAMEARAKLEATDEEAKRRRCVDWDGHHLT